MDQPRLTCVTTPCAFELGTTTYDRALLDLGDSSVSCTGFITRVVNFEGKIFESMRHGLIRMRLERNLHNALMRGRS